MYATSMLAGLALAFALAPAAHAQMTYKCTSADGTILYQQRPCDSTARETKVGARPVADASAAGQAPSTHPALGGRVVARSTPGDEQRAVEARAEQQRVNRCRSYRDTIARQQPMLDAPSAVARKHASDEIKIQERRIAEDRC